MVKQGPCYHCGVTYTPLWRNGPPDKPVLCNACGSRWRTKGTLANYTPMRLRAEPETFVDHGVARNKGVPISRNKEVRLPKTKQLDKNLVVAGIPSDNCQNFSKVMIADDDLGNQSSSGSAMSNTESCAQFDSADASDLTGPAQSVVWDISVPSRKRMGVTRLKPSAVEKLTQDLHTILQEQQSSCFSGSTEEDLFLECDTRIEMGHGSALIIHPSSTGRKEESEASCLSINNKTRKMNDGSFHSLGLFVPDTDMKLSTCPDQGLEQGNYRREDFLQEKAHLLGSPRSPLLSIELKDVLNFEVFMKHLTSEEQHQLMKYLPIVDTANPLESVKSLFKSSQFLESTTSFQHLLAEGVFDSSSTAEKGEDGKLLKRLPLYNLAKCKWIEHYNQEFKVTLGVPVLKELPEQVRAEDARLNVFMNCTVSLELPDISTFCITEKNATKGGLVEREAIDHDSLCFNLYSPCPVTATLRSWILSTPAM